MYVSYCSNLLFISNIKFYSISKQEPSQTLTNKGNEVNSSSPSLVSKEKTYTPTTPIQKRSYTNHIEVLIPDTPTSKISTQ